MTKPPLIIIASPDDVITLGPSDLAIVETSSGSEYVVACHPEDGSFWFGPSSRGNVASPTSVALEPGQSWRIDPPFIAVGMPGVFRAPLDLPFGDPRRVPGGGKYTSPVVRVVLHRGAITARWAGSNHDAGIGDGGITP
jgi:hypothetical protein